MRVERLVFSETKGGFDPVVIPIYEGVQLDPIARPPAPSRVVFAACPPHLATDLGGMALVDNEARNAWLDQVDPEGATLSL
jgi:hypothetical protein